MRYRLGVPRALVILATYNQAPHLERALRGYLRQTTQDYALVVADDGSGPETRAVVEAAAAAFEARGVSLLHVWHEDRGFRKCRILNEAVRRGPAAPLLVFSDGDCIPPAAFVARHLAVHGPRTFHVAGAMRLERAPSEALDLPAVDAGRYEQLSNAESTRDLARKARQSRIGTWLRRRNRPKILGLNFAVDRALFEAINGFDERFESWGIGEDSDVRDRLMRLRPRPVVRVLYGVNDVVHLWHPRPQGVDQRAESRAYHRTERPIRAERGLSSA